MREDMVEFNGPTVRLSAARCSYGLAASGARAHMKRCVDRLVPSPTLPGWWQPLFEASGTDSVFLSAAWMQTWIDVYGADFEGQWVHWEIDGRVVAGCLLVERVVKVRNIPFRSLFLNATGHAVAPVPFAEFNDMLCLPGHAERVATDLAHWLEQRHWGRLLVCGYERASAAARVVELLGGAHAEHEGKPARYVDLKVLGDQAFEASLSGKAGTHVRRNRREFQERLGEITVRRAADVEETLGFFARMRDLHLERWRQRETTTSLAADAVVSFHHRLIRALSASGGVEMIRVGSADQPIGFLYNFLVDGKVFVFQTGFAYEASSKWSPGLLTHSLAIEHYRQRGLREYDLLAGDALYKRTLCNGVRELFWTTVYRDRPWIRLLLAGHRLRNRLFRSQDEDPVAEPS